MRNIMRRGGILLAMASISGSTFVLQGCDPTARDSIIGGVEGSATNLLSSFVTAFFDTIRARAARQQQATTVMAEPHPDFVAPIVG